MQATSWQFSCIGGGELQTHPHSSSIAWRLGLFLHQYSTRIIICVVGFHRCRLVSSQIDLSNVARRSCPGGSRSSRIDSVLLPAPLGKKTRRKVRRPSRSPAASRGIQRHQQRHISIQIRARFAGRIWRSLVKKKWKKRAMLRTIAVRNEKLLLQGPTKVLRGTASRALSCDAVRKCNVQKWVRFIFGI